MKPFLLISLLWILGLVLSACNTTGQAPDGANATSTSAAQTARAVSTSTAAPTATQGAAGGLRSTPTLIPSPVPGTPTPAAACDDSATNTAWTRDNVLYDVNVVNTPLAPNTPFLMSWTFRNTGSCTWDSTYEMAHESGSSLTDAPSFPILQPGQTVAPGQTVTVNIEMTAPAEAGDYQAGWGLKNGQGEDLMSFGVLLKVGNAASGSLPRPGGLTYTYDCTSGAVRVSLSWTDSAGNEDGYRIYRDGTRVADLASDSTSYSETVPGPGTYAYRVAAFNATGESPSQVSVATPNCQ